MGWYRPAPRTPDAAPVLKGQEYPTIWARYGNSSPRIGSRQVGLLSLPRRVPFSWPGLSRPGAPPSWRHSAMQDLQPKLVQGPALFPSDTYPGTDTAVLRGRRIQERHTVLGSALNAFQIARLAAWEDSAPGEQKELARHTPPLCGSIRPGHDGLPPSSHYTALSTFCWQCMHRAEMARGQGVRRLARQFEFFPPDRLYLHAVPRKQTRGAQGRSSGVPNQLHS